MRFPVNHALPLAALILLGAAGGAYAADRKQPPPDVPVTGPAADYPVVVGEPYTIGSTVWTPVDQLNYDAVGTAVAGEGAGISGAHKTLPLPCYVEVTALGSGRTILVRLERRGPMSNDALVELSPDAIAQLGLPPGGRGSVRVRRVNPPEQERAVLRNGGHAPERMETPEGLLKVLRRKLANQSPLLP
uniref:septal ring lytic transglycosylase RlpA family protein n=2 Tax=unclassified Novosphingobium TaxID=2644732 RepID=UPI001F2FB324